MNRRALLAGTIIGSLSSARIAHAQTPTKDFRIADLLPTPEQLGVGWTKESQTTPFSGHPWAVQSVRARFYGPGGQRLLVNIGQHGPSRSDAVDAWFVVSSGVGFAGCRFWSNLDFDEQRDLNGLEGISEVLREGGFDTDFPEIPISAGAYAIEPDVVVMVWAEGDLDDLGDGSQFPADRVAEGIGKAYQSSQSN